jgi:hypothetical protein
VVLQWLLAGGLDVRMRISLGAGEFALGKARKAKLEKSAHQFVKHCLLISPLSWLLSPNREVAFQHH